MTSNNELEDLLNEFHGKITSTHLGVNSFSDKELQILFSRAIDLLSKNYEDYRKNVSRLLGTLEQNQNLARIILINVYFDNFKKLLLVNPLQEIDNSVLTNQYNQDTEKKLFGAMDKSMEMGIQIRISDFNYIKDDLSESDKKKCIALLYDYLKGSAMDSLNWSMEFVQSVSMLMPVLRNLLNDIGNKSLFYFLSNIVIDRYNTSEYYQHSRDLVEELILSSYIDEKVHLGYFNAFRCYSNNSNDIAALMYANLSISNALSSSQLISSLYLKEVIWQGIKFFRNIGLHSFAKRIYESMPTQLNFSNYERRSISHSYYQSLLKLIDPKLPSLVLDFLSENREDIIETGIHDALPWLLTMYNIQRLYPEADFSPTGLGNYITLFEMIVPSELVSDNKAIIQGDSNKLIPLLQQSLVKLYETRNVSDVVSDNEKAIIIASRIVDEAIEKNNVEGLLLAMKVKADYSFIFSEKEREEVAPIKIPQADLKTYNLIYGSESDSIEKLKKNQGYSIIWIICAENRYFQLLLNNSDFSSDKLDSWEKSNFNKLVNEGYFSTLIFEDTILSNGVSRQVSPEEFVEDSNKIKSSVQFAIIKDSTSKNPLLVVMDINIAGFPHNLFLNETNDFVYLTRPVCNILSTEWYLKYAKKNKIKENFTKSIWIPTEGSDFTINYLYSKLKYTLNKSNFFIEQSIAPERPISSELNILTAHGSDDIALKKVIYPDGNPRLNIARFLGKGKILILFICHSGSVTATPFKNSISTIIKQHISDGYSAVIAPFWSLHITIPPIWLPVLLSSIETGKTIVEAVHDANMAVFGSYPTPSAWSCMHIYGDPHLKKN